MTHYGKYRGTVVNNLDPLNLGRLQISCPAVLGTSVMAWAMPCSPYAGPRVGLFLIPPRDANIWIEFEAGDPDKPIWSGGFWTVGQTPGFPTVPALPDNKILKTEGAMLLLNDLIGGGGVTLEVGPPAVAIPVKIVLNTEGIEISCGGASVKLDPVKVTLNDGALEVM